MKFINCNLILFSSSGKCILFQADVVARRVALGSPRQMKEMTQLLSWRKELTLRRIKIKTNQIQGLAVGRGAAAIAPRDGTERDALATANDGGVGNPHPPPEERRPTQEPWD